MTNDALTDMCNDALDIVTHGRASDYGEPEDCFEQIAVLWNAYIIAAYNRIDLGLDGKDVARMMQLLKLARRIAAPQPKRDSYVDALGYVLCEARCENLADSEDG